MARKTEKDDVIELTQEIYDKLQEELDHKKNVVREEIADEITVARELGDLRENQAYSFAMDKKDRNEDRIKELEDMLKVAVISKNSANSKVVRLGSKVQITNKETKKSREVTLVGSEETNSSDPSLGMISTDSPIGKAINNAKVGDSVDVVLPKKTVTYTIDKIL